MAGASGEPNRFEVTIGSTTLRGEAEGDGPPVVLAHGLTATRRYVVHGSGALERAGHRVISYDARGHGSSDPAETSDGYGYGRLAADLAAVIDAQAGGGPAVVTGHSMGAHTLIRLALDNPERFAGIVVIGPVSRGEGADERSLERWDALADGLAEDGVEGFIEAYDSDLDPDWRETLLRIARERLSLHEHPDAVGDAIRTVSRDRPFTELGELESIEVPALVIGSHDEADPGHPLEVAETYAERLPNAELSGEGAGESPLAWQGGKLSREIARFCESEAVSSRL